MSVAFTREEDIEAQAAHVPDRPVSPHPNLVTATGLAAIESELAAARAAFQAAQAQGDVSADRSAMARASRDLRYWSSRRASAEVFEPDLPAGVMGFGRAASLDRDDGRKQRFRIVGEDEADAAKGSVSYVSPIAKALAGKRVGDVVEVAGHEIEIIAIEG